MPMSVSDGSGVAAKDIRSSFLEEWVQMGDLDPDFAPVQVQKDPVVIEKSDALQFLRQAE